jgi:putrescine importer
MAKLGVWMLVIGEIVIFVGFFVWSYAVSAQNVGVGHLISMKPFEFQSFSALASATSIAVLSYLGFDAITTLAEEAKNPIQDIPRAILWSVIIGGGTMFLTGYLGMLVIPNWHDFINDNNWLNSTLFYVASMTGGRWFELFYVSGFVLAMAVFNIVATSAGARILFGMGRDNILSKKILSAVNKRWQTPHWSIGIITISEFILGVAFNLNDITELVNYGALFAFIMLNLCVILSYCFFPSKIGVSEKILSKHWFNYIVSPLLGSLVLLLVFINMRIVTLLVGSIWLLVGIIYFFAYKKFKHT